MEIIHYSSFLNETHEVIELLPFLWLIMQKFFTTSHHFIARSFRHCIIKTKNKKKLDITLGEKS